MNGRFLLSNLIHEASVTPVGAKGALSADPRESFNDTGSEISITVNAEIDAFVVRRVNTGSSWSAVATTGVHQDTFGFGQIPGAADQHTIIVTSPVLSTVTTLDITLSGVGEVNYILAGKLWQPSINFNLGAGINLSPDQNVLRTLNAAWPHLSSQEASQFFTDINKTLSQNSVVYADLYPGATGSSAQHIQSRSQMIGFLTETSGPTRAARGEMSAGITMIEASGA